MTAISAIQMGIETTIQHCIFRGQDVWPPRHHSWTMVGCSRQTPARGWMFCVVDQSVSGSDFTHGHETHVTNHNAHSKSLLVPSLLNWRLRRFSASWNQNPMKLDFDRQAACRWILGGQFATLGFMSQLTK